MLQQQIFEPAKEIIKQFWTGLSLVVAAIFILLLGWVLAKCVQMLVTRFFKMVKIDKLAEDSGLNKMLGKANINVGLAEILGMTVYWLLMLVIIFVSVRFAGVEIPTTVIDSILSFIPKFLLGMLIFVFTLFLGDLFGGMVTTSSTNAGVHHAKVLGNVTQVTIVVFGVVVALQEIGIAADFIGNVFIIILASFCFGFSLAFALGAKDIVKKYLEEFLQKKAD